MHLHANLVDCRHGCRRRQDEVTRVGYGGSEPEQEYMSSGQEIISTLTWWWSTVHTTAPAEKNRATEGRSLFCKV